MLHGGKRKEHSACGDDGCSAGGGGDRDGERCVQDRERGYGTLGGGVELSPSMGREGWLGETGQ